MRNAKMDLAKRQAVGVFRAVPRFAVEAAGVFVATEGMKPIYAGKPSASDRELVAGFKGVVTVCEPGLNSSGRIVTTDFLSRKRGGCDPRTRGELIPAKVDRAGCHYHAVTGEPKLIVYPWRDTFAQLAALHRAK
jgi:hypothetical protein